MKKFYLLLLTLLLFVGITPKTVSAATPITVICDGQTISNESLYGLNKNGTIMIPYKILTNSSSITKVSSGWKASKKWLNLGRNNIDLEMYQGKKTLTKNNEFHYTLPQKIYFYKMNNVNQLMIPAKKICQLLGFQYSYSSNTNTLTLTSKKAITNFTEKMTTKPFLLMSTEEFVEAIGPIAQKEYHKSGILASVTIAQAINESWSGVSYLAQKGNNLFGMKTYLSGNTWKGTSWRGKRVVKRTKEQYGKRVVTITAAFRKYNNVAESFKDHSAYFVNAKNEYHRKRYNGITKTKSYVKQIAIMQKGGYCTFKSYGKALIALIKKYDLTRFDK